MHESRLALSEAGWCSDAVIKDYCKQYEPGTDVGKGLGNTETGDGYKFRGAGYIQLTGRSNYTNFASDIKEKYGEDPEILKEGASYVADKYAWESAGYFWESNNIGELIQEGKKNGLSDEDIFKKVSNAVNRGNAESKYDPGEWEDRKERYNEVMNLYN